MENLDLKIENYTLNEIKTFFKLPSSYSLNHVLDNEKQMAQIIHADKKIPKDKKQNIISFLGQARDILVLDLKTEMAQRVKKEQEQTTQGINAEKTEFVIENDIGKVVNQTTAIPMGGGNSFVLNQETTTINDLINPNKYLNPIETFPTNIARSNLNTVKRKTITQTVILNSLFREDYKNTTASDFQIQLPYQFKNVLSMRLSSIQLPNVIYCFSSSKMNNIMYIQEIIYHDFSENDIDIDSDHSNNKPKKHKKHNNPNHPNPNHPNPNTPNNNPPTHPQPQKNKQQQYENDTENYYDSYYKDYYYYTCPTINEHSVILPDGNYTIKELASMLQAAINDQMNICPPRFIVTAHEESKKITIKNTKNEFCINFLKDIESNDFNGTLGWIMGFREKEYSGCKSYTCEAVYNSVATDYLFFVLNDFNHSQSQNIVAMYSENYIGSNILAMIPLTSKYFHITFSNGRDLIEKKREYFGPVNIKKIKIELRDQYGELINLNSMDFSFSLELELVYDI